jgi:hypothetical protein
MKTVFNRGKCVVMHGASRRALRAVIFNHKQSMQIEFCARSQEICGQSIVSIVGRPKKNRPEMAQSASAPSWAVIKDSGEFVLANFQPCACTRGKPPKAVHQEKVRFGSGGRTRDEAMAILIGKV